MGINEKAAAFNYMIDCLLRSRLATGRGTYFSSEPNQTSSDEDVNVYLAHLLLLLANPSYLRWISRYISPYDSEVFESIKETQDRVLKYLTYKVNADYLLTSLGLFQNFGRSRGSSRKFYEQNEGTFIGRGKAYYEMAAGYHHQIYHHPTALEEVLQKLSISFEGYLPILNHMRKEYFNFAQRLSEKDFAGFEQDIKTYERQMHRKQKQDEFLDTYSAWIKSPSEELKRKLDELAKELGALDEDFRFPA